MKKTEYQDYGLCPDLRFLMDLKTVLAMVAFLKLEDPQRGQLPLVLEAAAKEGVFCDASKKLGGQSRLRLPQDRELLVNRCPFNGHACPRRIPTASD